MAKKSNKELLKAFNVKSQILSSTKDYNAFKDKDLLDKFRSDILEDLSDKGFIDEVITKDLINSEIDEVTYGYNLSREERNYLFNLIDGEVNGYGPITELLEDENITEIMVNSASEIFIEIDGKVQKDESVSFINDEHIIRTISRLIAPSGKVIDINNPMVDAILKDGSRINAIIPPLAVHPVITIRKFRKNIADMDSLIGNGALTGDMARFLEAAVKSRLNILVCGATGSGKTTILSILTNYINSNERIITIEDVRELELRQNHVISLETRLPNYEGLGSVSVRELVRNSLRMRPDRIIIGEVRGAEAFDLLQAMNTGHEGSLTTLHANNPKDALNRLETMVLMDGLEIPIPALKEYMSNAIDIIVYISRMRDGKRKITNISELRGVTENSWDLATIFEFNAEIVTEEGQVHGSYVVSPGMPKCIAKMVANGINDISDIFKPNKK